MPFLNSVHLLGHLSDAPTGREAGKSFVCNFRVGVNNGTKEKQDWANINCVIWGNKAKALAQTGAKGDVVEIAGKIITRSYETKDKKKVFVTEVLCGTLTLTKKAKDEFEEE